MKLTWIILLILIIHSLCNNHKEEQAMLLDTIFHYDFRSPPNIGDIVIWTISPASSKTISEPEIFTNHMHGLDTNKTYLIFTQTKPLKFIMYYWVGHMAPLGDKKLAAKYACQQYLLYQKYLEGFYKAFNSIVTREEEHIESESFQNTINFISRVNAIEKFRNQYTYVDKFVPIKFPSLYIMKGTNTTTRFKKVPFHMQWLKNDSCLLLETGYIQEERAPVMTYCGPYTSPVVQEKINIYRRSWEDFYVYVENNIEESLSKDSLKFKTFLEILEDNDNRNPYEIDDSQDHLKSGDEFVADRDNAVAIYKISQDGMHRIAQEEADIFSTCGASYLYDTSSVSGLELFVHYEAEREAKLKAVEMTEDYINENYSLASKPVRMRITEISESVRLNFSLEITEYLAN